MPANTPPKKQPNAKPQAVATPDQLDTNSAITPLVQNNEGLPDGWKWVKLGDVCKLKNGFAFKSTAYKDNGVPVIRISDINDGIVSSEGSVKVSPNQEYENYLVENDDILVAMSGATTGKFGIFKSKERAYQNQRVGKFKILDEKILDNHFLFHQINALKRQIEKDAYGGAQPNISSTKIEQMEVLLPPIKDQHAIVSKIEELLSELDKGTQQLETAQQQLKIYRQAVLKWAFEGKLSEDWRDKNRNIKSSMKYLAEVSEARKNKYLLAKKNKEKRIEANYDFEYEQSEVIKSWAKGKLDKLIYIAGRIGWRGLTKDEYTTKGPMFLSVHSLNYGKYVEFKDAYHISKERYLESPEITLKDQDILLCKDGAGIGKIGIVNNLQSEATVNSSLLIIRGLEIFVPEFLYYLLSGPSLQTIVRERITGSATPHLFQNDIRKFELLIPPLEEQKLIVQEIESRLSVCDKVEETITTSLKQAETLRQSILKKAFEGKLV
jgi:type I restriction enzyme S subunit